MVTGVVTVTVKVPGCASALAAVGAVGSMAAAVDDSCAQKPKFKTDVAEVMSC